MKIGTKVWLSSRINDVTQEIAEYAEPVEITIMPNYFTVMPKTGYLAVMQYGESIKNMWSGFANFNYFEGKIKAGDLMWIDGHSPQEGLENKYGIGATANAIVLECNTGLRSIIFTLGKNTKQVTK